MNQIIADGQVGEEQNRNTRATKLNIEIVREIRKDFNTNSFSQVELSLKYNTSKGQIGKIVNNLRWKE